MLPKQELGKFRGFNIDAYGFIEDLINYYDDAADIGDEVIMGLLEQMLDLALDYLIYE